MESRFGPSRGDAASQDAEASQEAAASQESAAAASAPGQGGAAGQEVAASQASAAAAGPVSGGALIRASDRERDDVLRRLQEAFAEGRLGDDEFDERMRAALSARTRADLDQLLTDLPAQGQPRQVAPATDWPADGRFAIAIKGSVRRGGRWRVPQRLTTFAYKGGSHLDLRAAQLTAPITAIRAVGYKSDVEIVVPPGVRVRDERPRSVAGHARRRAGN